MGNTASKFKKHLQRGDEFAVMQLYEKHSDLRKSLDANTSYGENYSNNTPLHFAATHAMKVMIKIFLAENGGNPNKRNGDEATALHLICQIGKRNKHIEAKVRAECLSCLLAWQGTTLANGECEKVNLDAVDAKKNTPLHYAAASGLRKCVEILVCKGANLFLENENKETACDRAIKNSHNDVGEYLESKMLFSQENNEDVNEDDLFPVSEQFNGLREQDLREAKDLLLVETADMLHIPLFTAETLLKHHEWSREGLVEAWMRDPVACCEKCGVHPAVVDGSLWRKMSSRLSNLNSSKGNNDILNKRNSQGQGGDATTTTTLSGELTPGGGSGGTNSSADHSNAIKYSEDPFDYTTTPLPLPSDDEYNQMENCGICAETIPLTETICCSECGHRFCRLCWKSYVNVRLQEGEFHGINCPAYDCSKLVPLELIELVLSPTMARKFLKFDIKAFVDSNPRIKWCPFPGCTNAVRLPNADHQQMPVYLRAFPKLQPPPPSSRAVCCPNNHCFCWDCSSDGHEPTSCDKWKEWHDKIAEVKPEELKDTASSSEMAANCLWLVTNSKPCPKCKSPIQKNDGCNHMKCSKCKHDFCWVCLGPWKKHSTETGGYFRCNRYDDSRKIDEKTEQAISEAKEQSKKTYELNRFVHYYARYKNHLNSHELEKPLLNNVASRISNIAKFASQENEQITDFSFIQDSLNELLRSRKVLSSSYAYGYFLKDCGYNKTIFEYLQNELEVSVEALSGLVGRNYLRGSRQRIVQTTQLVAGRRHRFLLCIRRGLLPPETPPGLRKGRKRGLPAILGLDKDDDDWTKSGFPKVDDYDPLRPWIRDSRGRHHNLLAILDWPDEDSDEEANSSAAGSSSSSTVFGPSDLACSRTGCPRKRAKNPRTGELHAYCSLKCQYRDTVDNAAAAASVDDVTRAYVGGGAASSSSNSSSYGKRKYNVDLMIALQMSRLQLLQDLRFLSYNEDEAQSPISRQFSHENDIYGDDEDADLQLAIERSVLDMTGSMPNLPIAANRRQQTYNDADAVDGGDCPTSSTSGGGGAIESVPCKMTGCGQSSSALPSIASPSSLIVDPRMINMYFRKVVDKESSIGSENLLMSDDDPTHLDRTLDKVKKVLLKSASCDSKAGDLLPSSYPIGIDCAARLVDHRHQPSSTNSSSSNAPVTITEKTRRSSEGGGGAPADCLGGGVDFAVGGVYRGADQSDNSASAGEGVSRDCDVARINETNKEMPANHNPGVLPVHCLLHENDGLDEMDDGHVYTTMAHETDPTTTSCPAAARADVKILLDGCLDEIIKDKDDM